MSYAELEVADFALDACGGHRECGDFMAGEF